MSNSTEMNVPGEQIEPPVHPLLVKLGMCTGSSVYYRHGQFRALLYTEGIKLLAQEGSCYWLLDIIGSVLKKLMPLDKMMVHVTKKDNKGSVVIYDQYTDKIVYQQKLPYTDFPFDAFRFGVSITPFGEDHKPHCLMYLFSED